MSDTPVTTKTCNNNIKNVMDEIKEVHKNFGEVHKEMGNIKDLISDVNVLVAGLPEKIIEKADKKYAGKGVEKIMWFVGFTFGGVVIAAGASLIIK